MLIWMSKGELREIGRQLEEVSPNSEPVHASFWNSWSSLFCGLMKVLLLIVLELWRKHLLLEKEQFNSLCNLGDFSIWQPPPAHFGMVVPATAPTSVHQQKQNCFCFLPFSGLKPPIGKSWFKASWEILFNKWKKRVVLS